MARRTVVFYSKIKKDDLIKMLCWLPITELIGFSITNYCFSALQSEKISLEA